MTQLLFWEICQIYNDSTIIMATIKQTLLDIFEAEQEELTVDDDVKFVYSPPSPVELEMPSRSQLLDE